MVKQNLYESPCTDVWWDVPIARIGNKENLGVHPTQKPLALCERAIKASSNERMLVLDLFMGTGSTLIAAEKLNRKSAGMEINPQYCQIIIDRFKNFSGKKVEKIGEYIEQAN